MSILLRATELVDQWLEVPPVGNPPFYEHKSACNYLSGKEFPTSRTVDFLERAYVLIDHNWNSVNTLEPRRPSKQNWRFERQLRISPENASAEVVLERAIARDATGDWANQIPTSSGLVGPAVDKLRNVALALRSSPHAYTFFELKVASNNPVFAAVEILLYGLLYLWSRTEAKKVGYNAQRPELFEAKNLALRTLAPADYYDGYDFRSLERCIDESIRTFAATKLPGALTMGFSFEQLHEYSSDTGSDAVRDMVQNRRQVYGL